MPVALPLLPDASARMHSPGVPASARRRDAAWLLRQTGYAFWSLQVLLRRACPDNFFYYPGGIGDELLCTAVFSRDAAAGARTCRHDERLPLPVPEQS